MAVEPARDVACRPRCCATASRWSPTTARSPARSRSCSRSAGLVERPDLGALRPARRRAVGRARARAHARVRGARCRARASAPRTRGAAASSRAARALIGPPAALARWRGMLRCGRRRRRPGGGRGRAARPRSSVVGPRAGRRSSPPPACRPSCPSAASRRRARRAPRARPPRAGRRVPDRRGRRPRWQRPRRAAAGRPPARAGPRRGLDALRAAARATAPHPPAAGAYSPSRTSRSRVEAHARTTQVSAPYARRGRTLIAGGRCVLLDGGIAHRAPARRRTARGARRARCGASAASIDAPDAVARVHRDYVAAGCDVITTNTWGLADRARATRARAAGSSTRSVHWVDVARRALSLARAAIADGGRSGEVAVAFSLNGDLDSPAGEEMIGLLARLFAEEPPDLRPARDAVAPPAVAVLRRRGAAGHRPARLAELPPLPARAVRRLRPALGRPGGRRLRPRGAALRGARRRRAADQLHPARPRRRDGLLPARLHRPAARRLPQPRVPDRRRLALRARASAATEYAELARRLARGGRAGHRRLLRHGPDAHRGDARARRAARPPGRAPPAPRARAPNGAAPTTPTRARAGPTAAAAPLYPLPFPDLVCEPGVAVPGAVSFMVWEHLFADAVGAHQRCLDVGCGTGIQAVQLARNGATHVRALDVDQRAVANTLRERVPQRRRRPRHRAAPWTSTRGCPRSATR